MYGVMGVAVLWLLVISIRMRAMAADLQVWRSVTMGDRDRCGKCMV